MYCYAGSDHRDHNKWLYGGKRYTPPCHGDDILWVRETWAMVSGGLYEYKADGTEIDHLGNIIKWKPSIHMPRSAARLFLKVKAVRVERLQEITEEDADAEGFGGNCPYDAFPEHKGSPGWYDGSISIPECFGELWDSIYSKRGYGWEVNPWVWVIEFEKVAAND